MVINVSSFICGIVFCVAIEAVVLCTVAYLNVRRDVLKEEQKDGKEKAN